MHTVERDLAGRQEATAAQHGQGGRFVRLPHSVRIVRVIRETKTVSTFVLGASVEAEPGQFLMVWLPGVDEKPISVAWADPLTITVARVGEWSAALHRKGAGAALGIRGPYGRPYRVDVTRPALLVGGGYGAAPLYYLASRMQSLGMHIAVALGARTADDLIWVDRFRDLRIDLRLATEDGSAGDKGLVTLAVEDCLGQQPFDAACLYACGPEGMLVALHRISRERGIPAQLSVERYMKCGFGVCGQCALDDILTCVDGPVLDAERLDGRRDFGRYHRTATGRRLPV